MSSVDGPRKASYYIFAGTLAAIIALRLGPVLLAGLLSYMIVDLTHRRLRRVPDLAARWVSVLVFLCTAWLLSWMLWVFLGLTLKRVPQILGSALPRIDEAVSAYGFSLPWENIHELKESLLGAIKENARSITQTTRGLFQVIVGIFIAILFFLGAGEAPEPRRPTLYDALRHEFKDRIRLFISSFEKVLGAQLLISAINACITSVYLLAMGFPYIPFLVLSTFVLGMLPLVGNVLSNSIIVGTGLAMSLKHAGVSLIFLVVIHKAEYFLNSRIVGGSIATPMWMTLLGILVGEMVLGVPGIMLAPCLIHYVREELQAVPAAL